jgi:hypothetical protein
MKENKDRNAFPGSTTEIYWKGMTKREYMATKAPPRPHWFQPEELGSKPEKPEASFEYNKKMYHRNHFDHVGVLTEMNTGQLKDAHVDSDGNWWTFSEKTKDDKEQKSITPHSHLWDDIMFDEKKCAEYNNDLRIWNERNHLHGDIQWAYYWADAMLGESLVVENQEE